MNRKTKKEETAIYVIDQDYKIVYYNNALQVLFPELECGTYCYKILCHEEKPCENCPLQKDEQEEVVFYNKWMQRWVHINAGAIDWPGVGACHMLMTSEIYNDNKSLFYNLTNLSSYDELIEINLTKNTYKTLYHTERNLLAFELEGSCNKMIQVLAEHVVHPDDCVSFLEFWNLDSLLSRLKATTFQGILCGEFRERQIDGKWHWMQQLIVPLRYREKDDRIVMCFVNDIHKQKKQEQLAFQRIRTADFEFDLLTGLYNRTAFFKHAEAFLREGRDGSYCLMAVDIEHFKLFNEWHGQAAGNDFLVHIACYLKQVQDKNAGVAGYFGDDDFVVLLANKDEQIKQLQQQILDQVKQYGNHAGFLPAFGMYLIKDLSVSVDTMYDRALIALAKVKGNYAVRVCWYEPSMIHKMEEEHLMLSDVQRALEEQEFTFYAQPQCDMATGKIVGAEFLVRWNHKTKGLIPPGEFIPLLEKNGFIADLDRYIWEKACRWLRSWLDRGNKAIPVSVNVSRVDIYSLHIADYFCELVARYQLEPKYIEVEITESAYVEEYKIITGIVEELRNAGFPVLMDDFGSGYSSLNMLKDVNVDVLKIDMKFLDMDEQSAGRGAGILEAVANMARLMGINIIVEGVETQEQVEFLLGMGCNYAQGYYFYHPLPVSEFEILLSDVTNIDEKGIRTKNIEQLHMKELLNENLFSETMVNNILGAIAFYDVCGQYIEVVRVNEQYYRVIGDTAFCSAQQAEGLLHYIYQADHLTILNIFEQAQKNQFYGAAGDLRYIREDGIIIWLHLRSFFLREQDGHKLYYASVSDVTEQHKREQLLEASQRALSAAISITEEDNSFLQLAESNQRIAASIFAQMGPGGMIGGFCEDGFPIYFANYELVKLLGYDSYAEFAAAIDYKVVNTIHIEDRERVAQDIGPEYYVGLVYTTTYRMPKKDGTWFWTLDKGKVVEAEDGRLAIISACMDISEIMEVQQQLAERNAFLFRQNHELQFLKNDLPGAYYRCSKSVEFDFIYVSERFLEMFGYNQKEVSELFNNKYLQMIHPEDRQRFSEKLHMLTAKEATVSLEYRILTKEGYIWTISQNRYMEYGGQIFIQGIVLDGTEIIELCNKMNFLFGHVPEDIISMRWNQNGPVFKILLYGLADKIGLTKEEYEKELNAGIDQLNIIEDYSTLKQDMQQAIVHNKDYHTILQLKPENGQTLWISLDASCVEQTKFDFHYLCLCRDITADINGLQEIKLNNRKLESALRLAGVNSWDWDLNSDVLTLLNIVSNDQVIRIHEKMKPGQVFVHNFSDVLTNGNYIASRYEARLQAYLEKVYRGKEEDHFSFDLPVRTKDHDIIWFHISCEVICGQDAKPIHIIGCYTDITEQRKQQLESQENMKVLELLRGQAIYDFKVNLVEDTIRTEKNQPQNDDADFTGRCYTERITHVVQYHVFPEFRQDFINFTDRERLLKLFQGETRMESMDYQWFHQGVAQWARMIIHLAQLDDTEDVFAYIFIMDIDQQKRQELRLAQMAETDALTGLYNRHRAIPEMKAYLDTHPKEVTALIMFDMDNFKLANDIFGHAYGDAMISKMAKEIKSYFREDDIVCRIGGDEFLVLCKNIKQTDIERKLQEIVQSLMIAYSNHGRLSFFSISAGYVMAPEQGEKFEELFKKADAAMFAAKMAGKNSCKRYESSMKSVRYELAEGDNQ